MSDDTIIRQLSKLTPDGAGLDRDTVLFAAGKASARPSRRWKAASAVLAVSQVAILGLFLLRANEPTLLAEDARKIPFSPSNWKWISPLPKSATLTSDTATYLVLRDRILSEDGAFPPSEPTDSALPDRPPLRAFGQLPSELLN